MSQINIHLLNFLSAKALTLCPYLHALIPLLHVNSRTNYCSQQPYFNVLSEKLRFSTLSRASNTRFLHIVCLFFYLFPTFSTPVFLSFFRTKKIASLHHHALFLKNNVVERQMQQTRHRHIVLWHKYSSRYYRHCGTKLQLDDSSGYYTTATVMRNGREKLQQDDSSRHYAAATVTSNGGAKPQKPTAQGNALGKRVRRFTPYRGKSKSNILTANCFCPYRTQLLQCTATSGRCPELCAY